MSAVADPEDAERVADRLLQRWDAQQCAFIKHRELRFQTITDMIRLVTPDAPRVLDLACGPGSLGKAIIEALPGASVVGVDKDPLLLAIARDAFRHETRMEFIAADFDDPDWARTIEGPFDAVVSSTALHWLMPEVLTRLYFDVANIVGKGGVFLNGDHFLYDKNSQGTLREVTGENHTSVQDSAFGSGTDTWEGWWKAAEETAVYADAVKERRKIWSGKTGAAPKLGIGMHLEILRSAGFTEVGTVWQYLDDHVICAIR